MDMVHTYEGFTIKCKKCGKETIYTKDMETNNNDIIISSTGYGGEVGIACKCGNEVEN